MSQSKVQEELIERIVQSNSFGRSQIYVDLLKYLVDCTEQGNIPKETTIGSQLFGSNAADDYDSAKVRVYVYNLRKKLKQYYQYEGKSEALVLTIPKGSYKVELVKKEPKAMTSAKKTKAYTLIPLVALGASLLANIYFWYQKEITNRSFNVLPENQYWGDFFESDKPTLVVIGDLFIYAEYDKIRDMTRTIRGSGLNSEAEFDEYKENLQDTTRELSKLTYTYLIKNTTACIETLTRLFFSQHKSFQTQVVTRMDVKDLHDHNIIFIGMQKTAGMLNNYFLSSKFKHLSESTFTYEDPASNTSRRFSPEGDPDAYHTDYGLVAKFPGPNNNTIFMFGGLWDTSVYEGLKNFTEPNKLKDLENLMTSQFGEVPQYFEVLFEVSGIDRTELTNKVLIMNKIEKATNVWAVQ